MDARTGSRKSGSCTRNATPSSVRRPVLVRVTRAKTWPPARTMLAFLPVVRARPPTTRTTLPAGESRSLAMATARPGQGWALVVEARMAQASMATSREERRRIGHGMESC